MDANDFQKRTVPMVFSHNNYSEAPMSTVTVTLSNDGQIFIPKPIRDQLHWEGGRTLILETTGTGSSLRIHPADRPQRLESLRGFLKQDLAPLSTEELCAPVDVTADWDAAERRSQ